MFDPPHDTPLTPIAGEYREEEQILHPPPRTRLERWREYRERDREPPRTWLGAVGVALVRLARFVVGAGVGAALLDHFLHRKAAFGFYCTGALLLVGALVIGITPRYRQFSDLRGSRMNDSFALGLAGFAVIGVAVAIDAFGG